MSPVEPDGRDRVVPPMGRGERLLWVAAVAIVVGIIIYATARPNAPTASQVAQQVSLLKVGQTEAQVRRLLGPPGSTQLLGQGQPFADTFWYYDGSTLQLDFETGFMAGPPTLNSWSRY